MSPVISRLGQNSMASPVPFTSTCTPPRIVRSCALVTIERGLLEVEPTQHRPQHLVVERPLSRSAMTVSRLAASICRRSRRNVDAGLSPMSSSSRPSRGVERVGHHRTPDGLHLNHRSTSPCLLRVSRTVPNPTTVSLVITTNLPRVADRPTLIKLAPRLRSEHRVKTDDGDYGFGTDSEYRQFLHRQDRTASTPRSKEGFCEPRPTHRARRAWWSGTVRYRHAVRARRRGL